MVVGQRALAHQRVRDRQRQVFGQFAHLVGRVGEQDAAADVHQRRLRREQRADDRFGRHVVQRGLVQRLRVRQHALPQADVDFLGEDVHRHVDQHRAGPPALGQRERLLDDLGEQMRRIHAPRPLHERPVDLVLRRVGMQVHFLVRMLAEVVRRHVAGNHHHRDRVERRIGHAGRGVGEPGRQVRQQHRRLLRRARVAVGRVRGDLLVPRVDELDLLALRQRGEHGDVRMAAEAEDVLDAARLEVLHQLVRDRVFHGVFPEFLSARGSTRGEWSFSRCPGGGTARRAGPL